MEVIAYTDRFSARPGERISFLVSTEQPTYDVAIIRHDRFFDTPDPAKDTVIASPINGRHPGRRQPIAIGSYTRIENAPALQVAGSFTLQTWIYPTVPARGRPQGIVVKWDAAAGCGYGLGLDADGALIGWIGSGGTRVAVTAQAPVIAARWYAVALRFDAASGDLHLDWTMLRRSWLPEEHGSAATRTGSAAIAVSNAPLLIGASTLEPMSNGKSAPDGCFNGKIDRVRLWSRSLAATELASIERWADPRSAPGLAAAWDPSLDITGTTVTDTGPNRLHGVIVNQPGRGVCGANWDGSEVVFRLKPDHYGAIAYHEDDLEDCAWEIDFSYEYPARPPVRLVCRPDVGRQFDRVRALLRPPGCGAPCSPDSLSRSDQHLSRVRERTTLPRRGARC